MKSLLSCLLNKGCLIGIICLLLTGCNPIRLLHKEQLLISKVTLNGVDEALKTDAITLLPKPNGWTGISLRLYNLVNSKKGVYKSTIRRIGQAPSIYDSLHAALAAKNLQDFLFNKGFLQVKVQLIPRLASRKKIHLTYQVIQGTRYAISVFNRDIKDLSLDSLYQKYPSESIQTGAYYDNLLLDTEADRLTSVFQNQGYKDFQKQYIQFYADSAAKAVKLTLTISNPVGLAAHPLYRMHHTYISIGYDSDSANRYTDTIAIRPGVFFTDPQHNYKAKTLAALNFWKIADLYQNRANLLLRSRLLDLGVFKFIDLDFKPLPENPNQLDAFIRLQPATRQSISLNGEYAFNGGNNLSLGSTYANKNLFKTGVLLELQLKGTLGAYRTAKHNNTSRFELGASLTFPRLIGPNFSKNLGKYSLPKTKLTASWVAEKRPELSSSKYSFLYSYVFREKRHKAHIFTPLLFSWSINALSAGFSDSFKKRNPVAFWQTEQRYQSYTLLGSQYSYIFNDNLLTRGGTFLYIKSNIELVGNSLYLAAKAGKFPQQNGQYTLAGQAFSQYIRPEIDLRWYKKIGADQLVFRFNTGFGLAYLNNSKLPFDRMFFVGGPNSIRAWGARGLGPGAQNIYQTESGLANFLINQQLGDAKLELNAEYRFILSNRFLGNQLGGAIFVDMGNIWFFWPSNLVQGDNRDRFQINCFYKQLALGTGFGLRFDFGFFILRTDFGLKLYDPQVNDGEWVIKHFNLTRLPNFTNKVFSKTYLDYSLWSINIGIGYPF